MLLINRTVMLIVAGNALGFYTGSGYVIPFSVDLFHFCGSFRVKSSTTIKIYISRDVLLINEVHNIIERNSIFEFLTTIWYKIMFWTQNRMNRKLCRIIRKDLGFIVVAHCFLQTENVFNFDKVEHRILLVGRYWWETSPVVGYVGKWKKRVASVEKDFKEWIFRVASCCLYMILTDSYLFYMDNPSVFGRIHNDFHIWEVFLFLGTSCKF